MVTTATLRVGVPAKSILIHFHGYFGLTSRYCFELGKYLFQGHDCDTDDYPLPFLGFWLA
jgi:hypothetical protein